MLHSTTWLYSCIFYGICHVFDPFVVGVDLAGRVSVVVRVPAIFHVQLMIQPRSRHPPMQQIFNIKYQNFNGTEARSGLRYCVMHLPDLNF